METVDRDKHVEIKTWAPWADIEQTAQQQIRNVSNLGRVWPWVAVMPDVHAGMGACIGSVIPTRSALIPSATGVDIGCGMIAIRTTILRDDFRELDLQGLRSAIEGEIPTGVGCAYRDPCREFVSKYEGWYYEGFGKIHAELPEGYSLTGARQCGTLGSGNHFIELSEDDYGHVWIVIHSGSRGIGNKIAMHHIKAAKIQSDGLSLPDPSLAFLIEGTDEFDAYWSDLKFAQQYAMVNRYIMSSRVMEVLGSFFSFGIEDQVHCHHNYAAEESHYGQRLYVTRKGAIRAGVSDRGIIPGSMGTRSYIVRGLGNKESLMSAPHGAGRVMSRSKARKTFTVDDAVEQTKGIECRKDNGILDELPGSYKDIDLVMEQASTLVRVEYELAQFVNVKG